jgi:hypothetical protein
MHFWIILRHTNAGFKNCWTALKTPLVWPSSGACGVFLRGALLLEQAAFNEGSQ